MKISELFEAETPAEKIIQLTKVMAEGAFKNKAAVHGTDEWHAGWEQAYNASYQLCDIFKRELTPILGITDTKGHWTLEPLLGGETINLANMVDDEDNEEAAELKRKLVARLDKKRKFSFRVDAQTLFNSGVEENVDKGTEWFKSVYPNAKVESEYETRGRSRYLGVYYTVTISAKDL